MLLAMAQTMLAIVVLFDLSLSVWEGVMILVLFLLQMIAGVLLPAATEATVNMGMSALYILIGLWLLTRSFGHFREGLRDGFRTPYSELVESEEQLPRPN